MRPPLYVARMSGCRTPQIEPDNERCAIEVRRRVTQGKYICVKGEAATDMHPTE